MKTLTLLLTILFLALSALTAPTYPKPIAAVRITGGSYWLLSNYRVDTNGCLQFVDYAGKNERFCQTYWLKKL